MPTSGGAYIPITASRKQISREIKRLMGNRGRQAPFLFFPPSWNKERRQEELNVHNWPGFNHTGAKYIIQGIRDEAVKYLCPLDDVTSPTYKEANQLILNNGWSRARSVTILQLLHIIIIITDPAIIIIVFNSSLHQTMCVWGLWYNCVFTAHWTLCPEDRTVHKHIVSEHAVAANHLAAKRLRSRWRPNPELKRERELDSH